jgi:glycosyltransferase involved in cell wall biosynthesis
MSSRLIITHPHSIKAPGGGTRSCLQITKHLKDMGNQVSLVPVSEDIDSSSADIFTAVPNPIHYLLNGLSVANIVQDILDKQSIDAVIGWEYETAFLPKLLKSHKVMFGMIAAMPSYSEWINRETKFQAIKKNTDEWFRWRPFKLADVVFVSSNFTKQELISLFEVNPEQIYITYRGVDEHFINKKREPVSEITNLIFYGSLAPIKGIFDAIDALGKVAQKGYRNWTLKIAGWGDLEKLKQALSDNKISENISFLGCLTPQELSQELNHAHLAILPSQAESFGRSIAEAQASGLAVVSYDVGSIPEIVIHNQTGWLVSPKRTDQLADAIIGAISQPARTYEMGIFGQDRVIQTFSWNKTAEAILEGIKKTQQNQLQS